LERDIFPRHAVERKSDGVIAPALINKLLRDLVVAEDPLEMGLTDHEINEREMVIEYNYIRCLFRRHGGRLV